MAIPQTITQQKKLTPAQLSKLVSLASAAPFSLDPLEVDEPLWGGFWQFDVLSPGYILPAVELALLRATRLDQSWPADTTPIQYLADLHTAIAHPQTGIWTTVLANQPCAVFAAAPPHPSAFYLHSLVIWYCASTECLHAGYGVVFDPLHFKGMVVQRVPGFAGRQNKAMLPLSDWLAVAVEQHLTSKTNTLAAQLDTAILRRRLVTNS